MRVSDLRQAWQRQRDHATESQQRPADPHRSRQSCLTSLPATYQCPQGERRRSRSSQPAVLEACPVPRPLACAAVAASASEIGAMGPSIAACNRTMPSRVGMLRFISKETVAKAASTAHANRTSVCRLHRIRRHARLSAPRSPGRPWRHRARIRGPGPAIRALEAVPGRTATACRTRHRAGHRSSRKPVEARVFNMRWRHRSTHYRRAQRWIGQSRTECHWPGGEWHAMTRVHGRGPERRRADYFGGRHRRTHRCDRRGHRG